jgi:hypothetical protein
MRRIGIVPNKGERPDGNLSWPTWTPDGNHLCYRYKGRIYTVRVD